MRKARLFAHTLALALVRLCGCVCAYVTWDAIEINACEKGVREKAKNKKKNKRRAQKLSRRIH